ncbi:hypothetical protein ACFTWD_09450 [Streptomyces sp. NPDC056943]|uniref:hypothetical protein n=1 Tax=Streptomyces sp. NPDC056943 TaxID=3345971 RepID=UPI00363B1C91
MADPTRALLRALADSLDGQFREAPMTQRLADAQTLVVADAMFGPGTYSELAERRLLDKLPPILPADTRDTYAQRLRLIAEEVAA